MKEIDFYQVDAFSGDLFGGNPGPICVFPEWPSDEILLSIARENNQAETGFLVPRDGYFEIRYFTIQKEIDMCGHATLASAHVLFRHMAYPENRIRFKTRLVGEVAVTQDGDWLTLDFPNWMPESIPIPAVAQSALGDFPIRESYKRRDYLFVYDRVEEILSVAPDFRALASLDSFICITAPGRDCDFVSRFFCPGDAYEEDPATGSAHSMLAPYWARRLGKEKLNARQLSKRGGELRCELRGDRVLIAGQARTYMQGKIFLPD